MADLLKYPLDLDSAGGEYSHRISFTAKIPRANSDTPAEGTKVMMYLPADALKTSYAQSYGDTELGALGLAITTGSRGAAEGAMGGIRRLAENPIEGSLDAISNALKFGESTFGGAKDAIIAGTVKEVVNAARGKFGEGAVAALEKKIGKVVNPHKAIIYQGPSGFRTFSYNFSMTPKSAQEAEEITKIVYFFKYHMHPGIPGSTSTLNENSVSSTGNINTSAMLTYPEEFSIDMRANNRESGSLGTNGEFRTSRPLFKIDKCFLESFNVDYSTQGSVAFYNDGNPVTTTISLSFKETVLMTKERIDQGY